MTLRSRHDREHALEQLRKLVQPGDTLYTTLNHVSRSGMQREISVYAMKDNQPVYLSGYAATALGERRGKRDGIIVRGCGMDMGVDLVQRIGYALLPDGFECIGQGDGYATRCPSNDHFNGDRDYSPHHHASGAYAIRQRWI